MGTESTEPGGISGPSADMILVVEDDESTSRLERIVLADEGYSVACAGSGEEALEMLTNTAPSLVILDIQLPRMDGFTTCQEIRERPQVPIIMVTGGGRDEDKVRGLEMGADDYITKPFSTIEGVARVVVVLRRTRIQRIHRTRTTTTRPTPSWPEMPILEHPPSPEIREKTAGIPTFGLMVSGGDSPGIVRVAIVPAVPTVKIKPLQSQIAPAWVLMQTATTITKVR